MRFDRLFFKFSVILGLLFIATGSASGWLWLDDGGCQQRNTSPELYYFGYPAEKHWTAVAVVPMVDGGVKEIEIWDTDVTYDPNSPLAVSSANGGAEFVVGDIMDIPAAYYYPRVAGGNPADHYVIEWSHGWNDLGMGELISDSVGGVAGECGLIRVWGIDLEAGKTYSFAFNNTSGNGTDIRLSLFLPTGSWYGRSQREFEITGDQSPYTYTATVDDTFGVVVFNNSYGSPGGSFEFRVDEVQETPLPDLRIKSIVPPSTSSDQIITATVTIENQGPVYAEYSYTTVSVDGIDACTELYTSGLSSGASASVTCDIGPFAAGTHEIEACANVTGRVTESVYGNNCFSIPLTVNSVVQLPDLIPVQIYPPCGTSGASIQLFGEFKNIGDGDAAPFCARFKVDNQVVCDQVCTNYWLPPQVSGSVVCSISPLTVGNHNVEFCVDPTDTVDEVNEFNNCMNSVLTISAAPEPDLVIQHIAPDSVAYGQPLTLSVTVRNQGHADAPATTTSIVREQVHWYLPTPAIPVGESHTVVQDVGILPVGSPSFTACADAYDDIDEELELNNCQSKSVLVRPLSITVFPDGSGEYPTIQAAMDAVAVGGYVILADGIFTGAGNRDLDFRGKRLTVKNLLDALPVIDCQGSMSDRHRGFYFHTGEDQNSRVMGVKIINGDSGLYGGGAVRCKGKVSPQFIQCIFEGNGGFMGGAVSSEDLATPGFNQCVFKGNHASLAGGIASVNSAPLIEHCIFSGNDSVGLGLWDSNVTVTNCTFDRNGAGIGADESSTVTILNTIISNSTAEVGVYCANDNKCAQLFCSDIYGNTGGDWVGPIEDQQGVEGNVSEDPLFCDAENGNYHLKADSKCAPENSKCQTLVGALPVACPPSVPVSFLVKPDGSGDYPTIQTAVNAAWSGDTILLTDGVFTGPGNYNIQLGGWWPKAVTIRSQSGNPQNCIIDLEGGTGQNRKGFVIVDFDQEAQPVLDGITIRNGYDVSGSGITCYNSAPILRDLIVENCTAYGSGGVGGGMGFFDNSRPTLTNCGFSNNSAESHGGGVYFEDGTALLTACSFNGNDAQYYGGAIFMRAGGSAGLNGCTFKDNSAIDGAAVYCRDSGSDITFSDCRFDGNTATGSGGGIYGREGSQFSLSGCTFRENAANYGGGMYTVFSCDATLDRCTFYGNAAATLGGALRIYTDSTTDLRNSILWGNIAAYGTQVALWSNSTLNVGCSDIQGGEAAFYRDATSTVNWEAGNLDQDPMFCQTEAGDFHLDSSSSCAAENNLSCSQIGAWPVGCGPYEYTIDASGTGSFPSINAAVAAAWDGVTITLESGTYTGSENRNINLLGKAVTIRSATGNPDDSIIDCENGGRGFNLNSGEGPDTVISGLTIKNCTATDGAGMMCYKAAPTVVNCRFVGNQAGNSGGGIRFSSSTGAVVTDCSFEQNDAYWGGGGIYNYYSNPTITDCRFIGNSSQYWGGAIHNDQAESNAYIISSAFTENVAQYGGAVYNRRGGQPALVDCTFDLNGAAYHGGAIYNRVGSKADAVNCIFRGNTVGEDGGAVYNNDSCQFSAVNSVFSGNLAGNSGGALFSDFYCDSFLTNCTFFRNEAYSYGGGIYHSSGNVDVWNSILWLNIAPTGSQIAMQNSGALTVGFSDVQGGRSNISDETGTMIQWSSGNIDSVPGFLDGIGPDSSPGTTDDNLRLGSGSPCIDAGDNFELPEDSFDLDTDGNVSEPIPFDLDQEERIVDDPLTDDTGNPSSALAIVDMGAYEYESASCSGDFDFDLDVDGSDLAYFIDPGHEMSLDDFAREFGTESCR